MAITTQPAPGRALIEVPTPARQAIYLQLSSDVLLFLGLAGWLIWDKGVRPAITRRLNQALVPIEEERRITNILAQIAITTRANRVILAAFHNGSLDAAGYHLQKLSTVNSYVEPGYLPMAKPIQDLPIGRIMVEIEDMLRAQGWAAVEYSEDLPQGCRDHLMRNDIHRMYNRLVYVGDLPIGILSLQYSRSASLNHPHRRHCDGGGFVPGEHEHLVEGLYDEIAAIMRRRIISPSPVHRILGTLIGTINLGKRKE
jgi:hypothetical protein